MLIMLGLTAGSVAFIFLLIAVLSLVHKRFEYRRADMITLFTCAALIGLAAAIDPLSDTVGKTGLYVGGASIASLLVFIGLKLEAATKQVIASLIVGPVLAALIAPTIYLCALAVDATDYQPPKRQPQTHLFSKTVHAVINRAKRSRP